METARLCLRHFRPQDWEPLHAYLSLEEVVKYEPYGVFSREKSKQEALRRSKDDRFWAVCLKKNGHLIGNLYLEEQDYAAWELGYVFHLDFWGKGYATEAASALLRYAFEEKKAHLVTASCNPMNSASWRLMERLGMRREGHLVKSIYFSRDDQGQPIWQDTYVYGILAEDYV